MAVHIFTQTILIPKCCLGIKRDAAELALRCAVRGVEIKQKWRAARVSRRMLYEKDQKVACSKGTAPYAS